MGRMKSSTNGISRRSVLAAAVSGLLLPRQNLLAAESPATQPEQPYRIVGEPVFLIDKGLWELKIASPFQRGENVVRVLLPDSYKKSDPHCVLYLLPVEEGLGTKWGEPLAEVRQKKLHDKHKLICVYPTFDTLPWYGRHATDRTIRHEQYMTQAVVPLIESRYATPAKPAGRLLVGFSKSGFGAVSLVLRNPEGFGVAGSWDAPLMMQEQDLGLFGTAGHFGDKATFAEYLPLNLIAKANEDFRKHARLVITGHDSFGVNPPNRFKDHPHTQSFHAKLDEAKIRHVYDNDIKVKHHWNTGWLERVIEQTVKLADAL
jgi:hypothetical protein